MILDGGGFADLKHRLVLVERQQAGAALAARLKAVGMQTKPDIAAAVRSTLGDQSMSHWRRAKPIPIEGAFNVSGSVLEMVPTNMAKGPMRVLQDGRQAHTAGSRRNSGTRVNKAGERVQKTRKVSRTSGATAGKGTWTVAADVMKREMGGRYERELVRDLGKHLRGG